jgi:hypothetical protein
MMQGAKDAVLAFDMGPEDWYAISLRCLHGLISYLSYLQYTTVSLCHLHVLSNLSEKTAWMMFATRERLHHLAFLF